MISKLVLVRHGKAKNRAENLSDQERALTKAGSRSCRAQFSQTLAPLLSEEKPVIWTSPALRASQTAKILSSALGNAKIEEHPELYLAESGTLCDALADASGCIVIVGHEPFMSDFASQLGNTHLPFDKGAAAAFAIQPSPSGAACPLPQNARLCWFVQGPDHERWKTLIQIEDVLEQAGRKIKERSAEVFAHPDDVEALHKYRISIRSARSLIAFLDPYLAKSYARDAGKSLKALQDPTSAVREMDVVMDMVEPGSVSAMICAQKRYDVRLAFFEDLQSQRARKALLRACKLLENPRWRASTEAHGLCQGELAAHLTQAQGAYEAHVAALNCTDQEAVHTARKQAKGLRYAARELAVCLPEGCLQTSAAMEEIQDRLGELCDAWMFERIARDLSLPQAQRNGSSV